MSIRANFAGTCADCGDRYPEGTPIQLVEGYGWCHDQCPDPTNVTGPAEVSCTACWLIHPLTADCDEW